jgi:hypothetical protein
VNAANETSQAMRQDEVMRYLLMRHSLKEISLVTGLSYQTVRNYCSDPHFQNRLRDHSREIFTEVIKQVGAKEVGLHERINELSTAALDKLEKLIQQEEHPGLALKACDSVLDRNEVTARNKKVETENRHHFVDPLMLVHAATTAQELEQLRLKPAEEQSGG